jgi:hypothetical protein
MRLTWLAPLAAALFAAIPAAAQISVTPIRDLAFGPVIVGIPTAVAPTHPTRSGQWRMLAPVGTRVRWRFTLPTRLDGPAGASLTINFGNNDGMVTVGPTGAPTTFNPKGQQVDLIVTSPTMHVFLGGRVTPAANQPQGTYTGTITFTVTVL